MIKRTDHDKKLEDGRPYVKKIVLLANKDALPMLYVAVDYNRVAIPNVWYVTYKLKKDPYCRYINLRIL
jgi:hypothetical protein